MVYQANKAPSKQGTRPRLVHAFGHPCTTRSSTFEDVYNPLVDRIRDELEDYKAKLKGDSIRDDLRHYETMKEEFESTIRDLKKRRLDAFDKLDRKIFTEDEFMEYKEHINSRIEETESALKRLVKPMQSEYEERVYTLHKVLESLKDERVGVKERNALLKGLIERIDYHKEGEDMRLVVTYK